MCDKKIALKMILEGKYDINDPVTSLSPYISSKQLVIAEKNQTIIYQNDYVNYFYFLLSGRTIILNEIEWNDCNIIDYVEPPHILGLVEYLNNVPTYTAYVVAETRCVLFPIPADEFIEIIKQDPELCYHTLVIQGKITDSNMVHAEVNCIFHPKDKLGHYLFKQAQNNLPYICPLTRNDLASKLHINLRTLYRYIDYMKGCGYLILENGKIKIYQNQFDNLSRRYSNIVL